MRLHNRLNAGSVCIYQNLIFTVVADDLEPMGYLGFLEIILILQLLTSSDVSASGPSFIILNLTCFLISNVYSQIGYSAYGFQVLQIIVCYGV